MCGFFLFINVFRMDGSNARHRCLSVEFFSREPR